MAPKRKAPHSPRGMKASPRKSPKKKEQKKEDSVKEHAAPVDYEAAIRDRAEEVQAEKLDAVMKALSVFSFILRGSPSVS